MIEILDIMQIIVLVISALLHQNTQYQLSIKEKYLFWFMVLEFEKSQARAIFLVENRETERNNEEQHCPIQMR